MLTEKEIELLQQNGKNVAGASREFFGSKIEKGPYQIFWGCLLIKRHIRLPLRKSKEPSLMDGFVKI